MSFFSVLTNDTITETWSGGSNKSDAWASLEADGGSITRKLGAPTTFTQNTVTHTNANQVVKVHMGTWVTDTGAPESVVIPVGAMFNVPVMSGYESAGQLNAYVYVKISVVTESAGVLSFNRTLVDWFPMQFEGTDVELGTAVGDADPMGGNNATNGHVNFRASTGTTLAIGERLAVEVGVDVRGGRNGDTANIEFGSPFNDPKDATLAVGAAGTGPYGSSIGMPFGFASQANQDVWGVHAEVSVPAVVGTDVIAWADIGTDWTVAKWQTTGAERYVMRRGGIPTGQFWIFQDDDYLYIAISFMIDGCIQDSDHQEVFLCPTADYSGELETDNLDWLFRRSITSGTSATRAPTLPILNNKATDDGEYILQGLPAATFPENWELPTVDASQNMTFASNGYTWLEGVDYRMGGPGATTTAPAPTGSSTGGSYSEFKISKAKLNNWNGATPIGIMFNLQCDVQGNGHTMYPAHLGAEVDKADWFFCGALYTKGDQKTAANQVTAETMDLRPLNSAHAHGAATGATYNPTETITGATTTQNGILDIGRRPSSTITSATTTQNALLDLDRNPSVLITGVTTTQDASISVGHRPSETITGVTTTQDATLVFLIVPSVTITGATTTQNAQLDIAHIHGATFTGATTTQDASISVARDRSATITGVTTTQNASISIAHKPSETITGVTTTQNASISIAHKPSETITGVTTTQDAQLDIAHIHSATFTGATTTQDASLINSHPRTVTITGVTTTQNANITLGGDYTPTATITSTTTTSSAEIDVPITYNPSETITITTSTQNASISVGYRPSETITGVTTTQNASISVGYRPSETITGVTTTADADITVGERITVTITGFTTTQDAQLDIAHIHGATFTGATTTQDAQLDIAHIHGATFTGATTTQDASLSFGYRITNVIIGSTVTSTDAQLDIGYRLSETITGVTATQDAQLDIAHIHSATFTGATTTQDANLSINYEYNPTETITGVTTTADANLGIKYSISETFFAITPNQTAQIDIGRRPSVDVTATTTTSNAIIEIEGNIAPVVNITGATTTQDGQVDIQRFPSVTVTSLTTTSDAVINIGHRIGTVIDSQTITYDADITVTANVPDIYNPTAIFPVYSRIRYARLTILVEQGTGGGGGFPVIAGGGYRESHADALKKRKLPTVKVLKIEVLGEAEHININISVIQVTDLLVEDG